MIQVRSHCLWIPRAFKRRFIYFSRMQSKISSLKEKERRKPQKMREMSIGLQTLGVRYLREHLLFEMRSLRGNKVNKIPIIIFPERRLFIEPKSTNCTVMKSQSLNYYFDQEKLLKFHSLLHSLSSKSKHFETQSQQMHIHSKPKTFFVLHIHQI